MTTETEEGRAEEEAVKLSENPTLRTWLGFGLIVGSPLAGGVMTVCVLAVLERFAPAGMSHGTFVAVSLIDAVIGAIGAAAGAMALPIRYWLRIPGAVVVALVAYFGSFAWFLAAHAVLHALLGIGPTI